MARRIETERLILRTVTVDDAEAVFKWASDPDVNKYMIYPLYKSMDYYHIQILLYHNHHIKNLFYVNYYIL